MPELFSNLAQVQEWYDGSTLAEREGLLKRELTNSALEKWFDDLSGPEQTTVFNALMGKPIPAITS